MSKTILGGGLGGLSAAYYLTKTSPKEALTLIESSSRTGGYIRTNLLPNGVLFEEGPRTIRPKGELGANTLQLVEELNLSEEIVPITSNHPAAKNRMIYAKGSLHMLPSSLLGLFKKRDLFSKPLIFHLLQDLKAEKITKSDESIYDFAERRFGKEVADYLISPMICGICAGNAQEISVKFLMANFFQYEQKHGSIANGIVNNFLERKKRTFRSSKLFSRAQKESWSIYSFKNGCETLPLALEGSIRNQVDLRLNSTCKEIQFQQNSVVLELDNETLKTDQVISALPASNLSQLLQKQHPELSNLLNKLVKTVSVAVVNLHFPQNLLKESAFGLLVAPKENLPILGIIFDSCCFKMNGTVLTVMMGGFWFQNNFGAKPTEAELLEVALEQVKNILQIDSKPENYKVNILHNCIPQYVVGHGDTLINIQKYIKEKKLPLGLCGASYHGVGINDVILSARNAAGYK